jgi:hypothetical protein
VAAVISVLIAVIALLESRRVLRVASVEAYPVAIERGVFLGMQLRNFGPRYAKDVRWEMWVQAPDGQVRFRQSLRMPILATGDAREVVIGLDPKRGQKRTLQALADSGGTLVSNWDWRDGRRIVLFERHHKERLEVALGDLLNDFANALQRQLNELLVSLADIRTAIEGVSQPPAAARQPESRNQIATLNIWERLAAWIRKGTS